MLYAAVCWSICVVTDDGFWPCGEAALDVLVVLGDAVSDSLGGCRDVDSETGG